MCMGYIYYVSVVLHVNGFLILLLSFLSPRSWRVRKEHHRETDENPSCQRLQYRVSICDMREVLLLKWPNMRTYPTVAILIHGMVCYILMDISEEPLTCVSEVWTSQEFEIGFTLKFYMAAFSELKPYLSAIMISI